MVLDSSTIKKINDFVYQKPRTIQEIASLINKNWRTANSYTETISKEQGTISIRTFRGGTRGALKVVFWNNIEKIHSTSFQERLFKQIESGRQKIDFSPSEIYQHVDEDKRKAFFYTQKEVETEENFKRFRNLLHQAEHQILFFSGNLTFSTLKDHDETIVNILEDLAKKKVNIKILTRVEVPGLNYVQNLLDLNEKLGREVIEIRHCFQPLRATIVDNKVVNFKETKYPPREQPHELPEVTHLSYNIYDSEWIEWLQKVFWNLFSVSIDSKRRINDFKTIQTYSPSGEEFLNQLKQKSNKNNINSIK